MSGSLPVPSHGGIRLVRNIDPMPGDTLDIDGEPYVVVEVVRPPVRVRLRDPRGVVRWYNVTP